MNPANRVEVAIIGAGVLGLACARSLAMKGKEVIILERSSTIGSGTSSRNSEVIHAGLYYQPQSLKALLCLRGKHLLYSYCQTHAISHQPIGKVIVATNPSQSSIDVPRILSTGRRNGVTDLVRLSREDVTYLEPEVRSTGGILSPSTGIVDSHGLMVSLLGEAEDGGASLALRCAVIDGDVLSSSSGRDGGIRLVVKDDNDDDDDGMELICDAVVNCSGLFADRVASRIIKRRQRRSSRCWTLRTPRHYFAKGNYFRLDGRKNPFSHLVYPVPSPGGLGVHATIDLGGRCRFGPDVEWIDKSIRDPDEIDLRVDPTRADEFFYEEIRRYWPGLRDGALVADYAGVRPKMGHVDLPEGPGLKEDFIIEGYREHGVKGFVNLLNMESPGLTSSLAVAEMVTEMVIGDVN